MAAWQERYKDKLISMEDAAQKINSGDGVFLGETVAISANFLNQLYKRNGELENVRILYNFSVAMFDMLFDPESKKSFKITSWFTGPIDRMSGRMGILDFHSNCYEHFIRETMDVYDANTMVIEVCEPDDEGYVNVGILSTAYFSDFLSYPRQFTKKIAIVNKYQHPAQGADEVIKVRADWFDYFVEDDHEMPYVPEVGPTPVDTQIAEHIMPYVKDGDTIQIGKGGLGEQITKELYRKKDIQVFSEIVGDSMIGLVDAGAVKKVVACGCFGTPAVYDFLGNSPVVEMRSLRDMLDPAAIGRQDNLVAINSTFMVDLLGQACSEAQGLEQYSSVGGAFGYMYGAIRSKGGRSFLCLRSTYMDKAKSELCSNIVAWLPEKCIVTMPKYLVMYVVSEYGVADVFLKTNKDRIRELIRIAHPDFRPQLREQIVSVGMITKEELDEGGDSAEEMSRA